MTNPGARRKTDLDGSDASESRHKVTQMYIYVNILLYVNSFEWRGEMRSNGLGGSNQAEGFEVVEGLGEGAGAHGEAEGFAGGG
jgi:hypothetical protein